jgi:hypothetical protein
MHKAGEEHKKRSYIFQFHYKRNVAAECLKVARNVSGLRRTQFEYHCLRPFFDRHEIQLLLVGMRFSMNHSVLYSVVSSLPYLCLFEL